MTDTQANGAMDNQPSFQIQRIYLKDASLEQPNSPQILLAQEEPKLSVEVDIQASQLDEQHFHVTLIGMVTTKIAEKVLFLVEAHQSGIFEITNMPAEQIDPLLGIACPTILFPYLRSNIADLVSRAGFQPVHLAEINFHALYEQRLQSQSATPAPSNDSGIILPN